MAVGHMVDKFCHVGPTLVIGHMVSRFCLRWARVGLVMALQPLLRLYISIFCQRWVNVGPMVNFIQDGGKQ